MLYDWNIHHFHIVNGRGDLLLFAYIREEDVHLLCIGDHTDFENKAIPTTLEAEWPGVYPRLHGIRPPSLSAQEIRALRKGNVEFVTDLNGAAGMSHVARSTSGTPILVTMRQDRLLRHFRTQAAELAKEHPGHTLSGADIAVEIGPDNCPWPGDIRLTLRA